MIRVSASSPWEEQLYPEPERAPPWSATAPAQLAFATLWYTGSDPRRDGLVRVLATRRAADGRFESFGALCRTTRARTDPGEENEPAGARLAREFGMHSADLIEAAPAEAVLRELHGFLAGRVVLTVAREPFLAWWRWPGDAPELRVLD